MRRHGYNVIANLAGQGGSAAITLLATPIFFRLYGAERVGVILFMATVATMAALIDVGLATTANRKIAESRGRPGESASAVDFVFTASVYYLVASLAAGCAILVLAEDLCREWLELPPALQNEAVAAMKIWGGIQVLRLPLVLLGGVINGLERQVIANVSTLSFSLARTICIIIVAKFVGPDLVSYATVYAVWTCLEFVVLLAATLRLLPRTQRGPRIDVSSFVNESHFALGVAVTTVCAMMIKMTDKMIVSGSLPVHEFALYQSIFLLSSGITLVAASVMRAYYPVLSRVKDDKCLFAASYRKSTRLISSSTAPVAGFLVINYELVLKLWTQSEGMAEQGSGTFVIVIVAMMMNSVMHAPQYVVWSLGNSKLTAINNFVGMLMIVPITVFLVGRFGLVGGALAWLIYNGIYFLVFPNFIHNKLLPGAVNGWYLRDVFEPFLISACLFGAVYLLPLDAAVKLSLSSLLLLALMASVFKKMMRERGDEYRIESQ